MLNFFWKVMICYFQGGDNPLSHRQKPRQRRMTA